MLNEQCLVSFFENCTPLIKIKSLNNLINVNARYLAHALIRKCFNRSACATLFRRRRNFF